MSIKNAKEGRRSIKSPLRYPGGKSRALKRILPLIPEFEEYREPMVGGGSVFFAVKQKWPDKKYWINDKNKELYLFWKYCKESPDSISPEKVILFNIKNLAALSNLLKFSLFFIK